MGVPHLGMILGWTEDILSAGPGGDEGDDAGGDGRGDDVVEGGPEGLEDVEGGEDQDGEEEGVVVEDGEGGGLVLGDLRDEIVVMMLQSNLDKMTALRLLKETYKPTYTLSARISM